MLLKQWQPFKIVETEHFEDGKIPMSTLLRDLLLCNKYGIKTLYYHNTRDGRDDDLQDQQDVKLELVVDNPEIAQEEFDNTMEEECDSCTI